VDLHQLDEAFLAESLTRYQTSEFVSKETYFVSPHPIYEILAVASERMNQPIRLLVTEQGPPDHFFLTSFTTFKPVIFSARYIALATRINRLFPEAYATADLRPMLAEGIAFDAIAEFFLMEGDAVGAALSFMKARVAQSNISLPTTRSLLGVGSDLLSSEAEPVDELYIADMFFGLAHEIGHAIQESGPDDKDRAPWCSDDLLMQYVEWHAARSTGDAGLTYREAGASAVLHPDRLRHEAGADIEACRLIARAARSIVGKFGQPAAEPQFHTLMVGVQFSYLFLGFLRACRRVVTMNGLGPGDRDKAIELLQEPLAFAVRQQILQDHLPIIAAEMMAPDRDSLQLAFGAGPRDVSRIDCRAVDHFRAMWTRIHHDLSPFAADLDSGLLSAMDFFNRDLRDGELGDLFATYQDQGGHPTAARHFIALAESMALSDDVLAELELGLQYAGGTVQPPGSRGST